MPLCALDNCARYHVCVLCTTVVLKLHCNLGSKCYMHEEFCFLIGCLCSPQPSSACSMYMYVMLHTRRPNHLRAIWDRGWLWVHVQAIRVCWNVHKVHGARCEPVSLLGQQKGHGPLRAACGPGLRVKCTLCPLVISVATCKAMECLSPPTWKYVLQC